MGTLYSRANAEFGELEGVKLIIPDWTRSQRNFNLVDLFNLLGPAR